MRDSVKNLIEIGLMGEKSHSKKKNHNFSSVLAKWDISHDILSYNYPCEMVLLSTHNISFGWEIRKLFLL